MKPRVVFSFFTRIQSRLPFSNLVWSKKNFIETFEIIGLNSPLMTVYYWTRVTNVKVAKQATRVVEK